MLYLNGFSLPLNVKKMIKCCIKNVPISLDDAIVAEFQRKRFLYQSNQECVDNRFIDTLKVVNALDICTPSEIHWYDYSISSLINAGIPVGNTPVSYVPSLDDVIAQVEHVDGMLQAFIDSQKVESNERIETQA